MWKTLSSSQSNPEMTVAGCIYKSLQAWGVSDTLQAAHAHGGDVVHAHCFLYYEWLPILDTDQVAIESGDGGQALADFFLLRAEIGDARNLPALRIVGKQGGPA